MGDFPVSQGPGHDLRKREIESCVSFVCCLLIYLKSLPLGSGQGTAEENMNSVFGVSPCYTRHALLLTDRRCMISPAGTSSQCYLLQGSVNAADSVATWFPFLSCCPSLRAIEIAVHFG